MCIRDRPNKDHSAVAYSGSTTGNRNPLARASRNIFGTYDRIDNTFRGKIKLDYKIPGIEGLKIRGEMNVQVLDRSEKTFRKPYDVYRNSPSLDSIFLEGTGNAISSVSDEQFRRTMLYPLIAIEFDTVSNWALRKNIPHTTYRDLSEKKEVKDLVWKEIIKANEQTSTLEIRKFRMIPKELDHEDGELTATQKIKRNVLMDQFGELIEEMYS